MRDRGHGSAVAGRGDRAPHGCDRVEDGGEQPFNSLLPQMGHVVVELVGQWGQRSSARPAHDDLLEQPGRELLSHLRSGNPQHLRSGLARPSQAGIIERCQLCPYPGPDLFQQRGVLPRVRLPVHRLAEHLTDHHGQFLGRAFNTRPQLLRSALNRYPSGFPECFFLIRPPDQRNQPPAPGVSKLLNTPGREIIGDEHCSRVPSLSARR
jgi:hypothetical protein